MPAASTRRWFQFSLRGLFVAVTLLTLPLAWTAYSLRWIQIRNALLEHDRVVPLDADSRPDAPWGLWLFGEGGYRTIVVHRQAGDEAILTATSAYFPEADVRDEPESRNP